MKSHLSISIATILALSAPGIAKAQIYVTATIGGVPSVSGATLENFDGAQPPSILTLTGYGGIVTGNAVFSQPYFSGTTAAYFGETPANGPDATQYIGVYGQVYGGGAATFSFPTPQNYFGLLWGSTDPDNSISFYDSANNLIGTVLGTQITGNPPDAGPNGTFYVNITSTIPFSTVVAATPVNAFEFDDVAYAVVPEPTSLSLLAFGILGMTLVRRRQR
jgi:PEP-CTERM motif